jgi:hypothetical protein
MQQAEYSNPRKQGSSSPVYWSADEWKPDFEKRMFRLYSLTFVLIGKVDG